jgi:hypothetical protein
MLENANLRSKFADANPRDNRVNLFKTFAARTPGQGEFFTLETSCSLIGDWEGVDKTKAYCGLVPIWHKADGTVERRLDMALLDFDFSRPFNLADKETHKVSVSTNALQLQAVYTQILLGDNCPSTREELLKAVCAAFGNCYPTVAELFIFTPKGKYVTIFGCDFRKL